MSRNWYVEHNGRIVGPVKSSQLKDLVAASKISRDTRVRLGNDGDWVRAAKVQGLFATAVDERPKQQSLITKPPAPVPAEIPTRAVTVPEPAQVAVAQRRPCPYCGEEIALSAIKCRHCNEYLDGRPQEAANPQSAAQPQQIIQITNVNTIGGVAHKRWSPLVAALLSFLIPGLGQLYKGQVFNGALWFILTVIGYAAFVVPGLILHLCCVFGAVMGDPYK